MAKLLDLLKARYPDPNDEKESRLSAKRAGYVELAGAEKDADCEIVHSPRGISAELGCCNYFKREDKSVQQFKCGTCKFKMEYEK